MGRRVRVRRAVGGGGRPEDGWMEDGWMEDGWLEDGRLDGARHAEAPADWCRPGPR